MANSQHPTVPPQIVDSIADRNHLTISETADILAGFLDAVERAEGGAA